MAYPREVLLLATVVLAGCGGNGDVPMNKKALLPSGAEVDLILVSEAVWAREAAYGFRALSTAERVFLCVWNLEAEVNNGGFEQFYNLGALPPAPIAESFRRRLRCKACGNRGAYTRLVWTVPPAHPTIALPIT